MIMFCENTLIAITLALFRTEAQTRQTVFWNPIDKTSKVQATRTLEVQHPEKNRFMFVEKLSKRCCIQVRVLYNYLELWCP